MRVLIPLTLEDGDLGKDLQPPESRWSGGGAPIARGFFQFLNNGLFCLGIF